MLIEKMTISMETLEKLNENILDYLTDDTSSCGAWFDSKEDVEEWMGDVFFDTLLFSLENLGFVIEEE